jgi:hypothetical protein
MAAATGHARRIARIVVVRDLAEYAWLRHQQIGQTRHVRAERGRGQGENEPMLQSFVSTHPVQPRSVVVAITRNWQSDGITLRVINDNVVAVCGSLFK